jgi:hypothetical protein
MASLRQAVQGTKRTPLHASQTKAGSWLAAPSRMLRSWPCHASRPTVFTLPRTTTSALPCAATSALPRAAPSRLRLAARCAYSHADLSRCCLGIEHWRVSGVIRFGQGIRRGEGHFSLLTSHMISFYFFKIQNSGGGSRCYMAGANGTFIWNRRAKLRSWKMGVKSQLDFNVG